MSDISFISVKFNGDYSSFLDFIGDKNLPLDIKKKDENVAVSKLQSDTKEELCFFKGVPSNIKGKTFEILEVTEINEEEYNSTEDLYEKEKKEKEKEEEEEDKPLSDLKSKIENQTEEEDQETPEEPVDEKVFDNVPISSRIHLSKEDPMYLLTSKDYLFNFFIISTTILIIFTLFN